MAAAATGARLYSDLHFADLRRCQLDIETGAANPGSFSDARNPGDRVLAIGLQCGARRELLTLGEETDAGEKRLLLAFNDKLRELDPDVVEGHNIFKFDLDYLRHALEAPQGAVRLGPVWAECGISQQQDEGGGALD